MANIKIDNPDYYNWHPLGIECVKVVQEFPYNIGVAMAYLWRNGRKIEEGTTEDEMMKKDIQKAIHHLQFELERIEAREKRREVLATWEQTKSSEF